MESLFKKTAAFVDSPKVRLILFILWSIWLCAAIPCFGISLLEIILGDSVVLRGSIVTKGWDAWFQIMLLGFAGMTQVFGVAIRLANTEEKLTKNITQRVAAQVCLGVGLIAELF